MEPNRPTLLAVDDDATLLKAMRRSLEVRDFDIVTATGSQEALAHLADARGSIEAVILDVQLGRENGLEVLEELRRLYPTLPVVMLTGDSSAQTAVEALQLGAHNYINKPVKDYDAFAAVLRAAVSYRKLAGRISRLERELGAPDASFVGSSPRFHELRTQIERVAAHDVTVLITGESGTGKELVARRLHELSPRAGRPFVAINCAAYPETLIDAELFGHEKGAFTGAATAKPGIFERAQGGTVFLDEIGDVKPDVQVRLLRVLQERQVQRLGALAPTTVDVRVVAATLVDLEEAVEEGSFRTDLFYRLNVVRLYLPPLRERQGDLGLLIAHFLSKHCSRMNRAAPVLEPAVLEAFERHHWPGNVRELENVVQGLLAMAPGDVIGPELLPPHLREPRRPLKSEASENGLAWADGLDLRQAKSVALERFHRAYIGHLLETSGGNITEAASRAGVDRSNFRRIMTRYGITASS